MLYKNFMGGVWMESASEKTFKSYNPAHTGQELGEFQDSNELDINQAVDFARDALKCGRIHLHQNVQRFFLKQHRLWNVIKNVLLKE